MGGPLRSACYHTMHHTDSMRLHKLRVGHIQRLHNGRCKGIGSDPLEGTTQVARGTSRLGPAQAVGSFRSDGVVVGVLVIVGNTIIHHKIPYYIKTREPGT